MEKKLAKYILWYKTEREKSVRNIYLGEITGLKVGFLDFSYLPYSKWDTSEIIKKDLDFSTMAVNELIKNKFSTDKKILSISILAISNRIEYISDQADFYPIFATLIAFLFTFISIGYPLIFKIFFGACALGGILFSFIKRSKLRQEVADYKEIVNVLNQYKRDYCK